MANVPTDLKYAKSHEWVRVNGDTATVGISDHAQHELTDVVFVELPALNRQVKAGEACAVVESVKTASDIYSPVSGQVRGQQGCRQSRPGQNPWRRLVLRIKLGAPAVGRALRRNNTPRKLADKGGANECLINKQRVNPASP
jgi:hypothetical protein